MLKRGLLLGFIILFASFVYAAPNPELSLEPISLYETQEKWINLTVNNYLKNEVITSIALDFPGAEITEAVDYDGWSNEYSSNFIRWYDGSIETNIIEALFQFRAKAPLVDENQSHTIIINTTGPGGDDITEIDLEIINDDTAPELINANPEDDDYFKEGVDEQEISVIAIDPETGVFNVSFSWYDCTPVNDSNASNSTPVVNAVELDCEDDLCKNEIDLSEYKEGDEICFEFTAYNNGLGKSTLNGSFGFDGTPPTVELISPEDDAELTNGNISFEFNASDNLADELECSLYIDNEIVDTRIIMNGAAASVDYSLDDGTHDWKVECLDKAEWSAESEERSLIIDSETPVIELEDIEFIERGKDYLINISVIDDVSGVEDVTAVFDENTTIDLTKDGDSYIGNIITDINYSTGNYSIVITAADNFGNSAELIDEFELLPRYVITIDLSSDNVKPEEQINVSGEVKLDDGGNIAEDYVILILPNETINISIDADGNFNYSFNAPEIDGVYSVKVEVTNDKGYTYNEEKEFTVEQEFSGTSESASYKDSGSGSGGIYCGDGNCGYKEDCKNCQEDCGICTIYKDEDRFKYKGEEIDESSKEIIFGKSQEEERMPTGVGKSAGWFGLSNLSGANLLMILALGLIIITLGYLGKTGKFKRKKINWNNYFNRNK